MPLLSILLLLLAGSTAAFSAEMAKDPDGEEFLERYLQAGKGQAEKLKDLQMEMEIDARVPNLKKSGKLKALRQISRLGVITYRAITFQGDKLIQNDVIAKYLQAEKEAALKLEGVGINRENYRFKYYGLFGTRDWQLHLFELSPKSKRPGLFVGWLWVESNSSLPVREQGEFVKSPSIFLKKVAFVRDYEIRDGVAVPVRIESNIETRIVGPAQLTVRYRNHSKTSADEGPRFAGQTELAAQ